MTDFDKIQQKLKQFSSKYYTNELIKGFILFISLGLLYLLFTLFIEYFLWLKPTARTILFWVFIAVELFLLVRFIGFPLFKLFGIKKGISQEESSKIIGNYFPEVKDKLLNVLQLKQSSYSSDLLIASIEQKARNLKPIPFVKAVNFKTNLKYAKYLLIPLFIWLISLLSGANKELSQSFSRVVNHTENYIPPAPFYFNLLSKKLTVVQGEPLTVAFSTLGDVVPDEVKIIYKGQQYFLNNQGNKTFSYTFSEINSPFEFFLKANNVSSNTYKVNVIKTPTIQNINLELFYPSYTRKKNEKINNTGNITIPQGTVVKWNVKTHQTDSVLFINQKRKSYFYKNKENYFSHKKRIKENINYQIAVSNQNLSEYEKLQFAIDVVKDEHPLISVTSNIDSISRGTAYFAGQISDDYGLSALQIVYYNIKNPHNQQTYNLKIGKENVQSFFYEFPKNLNLQKGIDYELFFQVFDNDAVNGNKKASSRKFSFRKKTDSEEKEELLSEQKSYIKSLENSLEKQQNTKKEVDKIQFDLQNKKQISWNDQKKITDLVKRQKQYQQMMQQQAEKIQENFSEKKEQSKQLEEKKEELKNRIEELKKLEKQQKLLDELMKVAEKLKREELINKTKELAEQNKQQERSLERILELTKRFYVEQKATQIQEKLKELAKKQESLSQKKETKKEEQEKINTEFDEIQKELKELQKENQDLKRPMDIPHMDNMQKKTQNELNKAKEKLSKEDNSGAKKNQKNAAKKMRQMSSKMEQSMQAEMTGLEEENEKDLRKILENLLIFSFKQEDLLNIIKKSSADHPDFGKNIRKQHQLKTYFEHIDDSLFVLSMRSPKISSKIQDQLAIAHYNLDQSLNNLSNNRFNQGSSNQQYVMTAANTLADMLSDYLNAMKNPKQGEGSGKGKGKGKSISLPDIIQKQSELMEKMKKGMGKKQGEGKNGKEGEGGKKENQGNNEQMNEELYKIYQEQARLRQQLENAIKNGKEGNNGKAKRALQKMEQLENKILEKGFSQENIRRMQDLNYELLKLDKATFEQGMDEKRKSTTSTTEYEKKRIKELQFKEKYFNQNEILNRQSLPLQQIYKKRVQEYFKKTKD